MSGPTRRLTKIDPALKDSRPLKPAGSLQRQMLHSSGSYMVFLLAVVVAVGAGDHSSSGATPQTPLDASSGSAQSAPQDPLTHSTGTNNTGSAWFEEWMLADSLAANALIAQGDYRGAYSILASLVTALESRGAQIPLHQRSRLKSIELSAGVAALRLRQPDRAQRHFESVLARAPQHAGAQRNLGLAHLHQRRYSDAILAFERALRLQPAPPTLPRLYLDLGRALFAVGNHSRAHWALTRAVRLAESTLAVELQRPMPIGHGAVDADNDTARMLADSVDIDLSAWGSWTGAHRELARFRMALGEPEAARVHLQQALRLAPGDPESLYLQVQILSALGLEREIGAARARFQAAAQNTTRIQALLKADSGRLDALTLIADIYRSQGLLHLAHARYRQQLERQPDDRHARLALHYLRARALAALRQTSGA